MYVYIRDSGVYVDDVYEEMEVPSETPPPVPPRHRHTMQPTTGRNKSRFIDDDGYLRMHSKNRTNGITTADTGEIIQMK